jgi:hypothetical protein
VSRELEANAIQASKALERGGGTPRVTPLEDAELHLNCAGDRFITWEDDARGNALVRPYNLPCAVRVTQIGSGPASDSGAAAHAPARRQTRPLPRVPQGGRLMKRGPFTGPPRRAGIQRRSPA